MSGVLMNVFTETSGGGGGGITVIPLTVNSDYEEIDISAYITAAADGSILQFVNYNGGTHAIIALGAGQLFSGTNPDNTTTKSAIGPGGIVTVLINKATFPGTEIVSVIGQSTPYHSDFPEALSAQIGIDDTATVTMQGTRAKVTLATGAGSIPVVGNNFIITVECPFVTENTPICLQWFDESVQVVATLTIGAITTNTSVLVRVTPTVVFGTPEWVQSGFYITIG